MPLTPFHFGPALLFGILLLTFMDFPTFLVANVIVDLEPFTVLCFDLRYPLHGFFHSFVGGTIVAILLTALMARLSPVIGNLTALFGFEQKPFGSRILTASLIGVYSHILLDAPLYPDIRPFYPFDLNPFFSSDTFTGIMVYAFCVFCFLGGVAVYVAILVAHAWKRRK